MSRFALAVGIALCLSTAPLYAQSQVFTVSATSAGVFQAPSTSSPLIGHKGKGEMLEVRRDLGTWIEVSWPGTARGVGYVPAASGSIGQPAAAVPAPRTPMSIDEFVRRPESAQALVPPAAPVAGAMTPSTARGGEQMSPRTTEAAQMSRPAPTYVAPTHFLGIGGRVGGVTRSFGASGRSWSRSRVGVQFEVSRDARTNAALERVTTMQFAPSVLYALPNQVSDYLWLRPYVGGGMTLFRSSFRADPAVEPSLTDSSFALQMFGGGEITFAGMPRFALSADLGYHKYPAPFAGFETRKIGLAISGHWFVR